MSDCAAVHPEHAAVCRKTGMHEFHLGQYKVGFKRQAVSWPNEDYIGPTAPPTKAKQTSRLNDLVSAVKQADAERNISADVPVEAVAAWSKEAWVSETTQALKAFLAQRTEDFTTAEDLWPLIDAPREMRAMVLPVRAALKHGWITEVGSRRLRGVYRTRDGVEFAMNKLVPVYRSALT